MIRVVAALVTAVALAAGGILAGTAAPAHAAGAVQLGPDGSDWSGSWNGALFSGVRLVPGGSEQRPFWLRNASTEAAYVRVTLTHVVIHDPEVGAALAVRASLPGWPGSSVAVTAAQPCYVLAQGPILPSGGVTRVDVDALLGDLSGQSGQSGSVSFDLMVSLTSTALTSLPPTECPSVGTEVIGIVGDPGTGRPGYAGTTGTAPGAAGTVGPLSGGTAASGPGDVPGTSELPATRASAVEPNTGRLWQELDVAFWLLLAVVGALTALRRPRKTIQKGSDR